MLSVPSPVVPSLIPDGQSSQPSRGPRRRHQPHYQSQHAHGYAHGHGHRDNSSFRRSTSFPSVDQQLNELVDLSSLHRFGVSENLHRFVAHATPSMPASMLFTLEQKNGASMEDDAEEHHYFKLADLWSFYDQPYGHEVPLVIDGRQCFAFFSPYLSGIRLFAKPMNTHEPSRLLFEYFENATPDQRVPMANKIRELSKKWEPLVTASTCFIDLQKSWYAISWYPILCDHYTSKAVTGCFVTYHTFEVAGECPFLPLAHEAKLLSEASFLGRFGVNPQSSQSPSHAHAHAHPLSQGQSPSAPMASEAVSMDMDSDDAPSVDPAHTHAHAEGRAGAIEIEITDTGASFECEQDDQSDSGTDFLYECTCQLPEDEYYLSFVGCIAYKVRPDTWYDMAPAEAPLLTPGALTQNVERLLSESRVIHPDHAHIMKHYKR